MKIEFLGTTSTGGHCPSAFKTDRGTYLVQGARVTDEEALAEVRRRGLPDHETVVEIPASLIKFFD
ncbi:ubiquitin family protein [Actinophytocola sediminis]